MERTTLENAIEALTFYADPRSYCSGHNGPDVMFRDGGRRAKEALAALPRTSTLEQATFVQKVLELFEEFDEREKMFWSANNGATKLYVLCNDFFWWAVADAEDITPKNVALLRACFEELTGESREWAPLLFCARVRQLRPQGCCYPKEPTLIALFDACGPKRAIDIGNPYNHPEDGGEYAYACEVAERPNLEPEGDRGER